MSRAIAVGIFTLGALLILMAGVFIIGKRQLLFADTYEVMSRFPDVAGLDPGAEVRVGGVRKGSVTEIRLPKAPDRQVTVVLSLDRETRSLVRRDSVASIQTEGLLGNKYVAVSFGSADEPPIRDGDTIPSQPTADYAALIDKTSSVLRQTGEALEEARTALKAVTRIGQHLENVAAKIDRGEGTIGALVNDRKLYDQANQILDDAQKTTRTVRTAAEDLSKKASDITDDARYAVADIRRTTSRLATDAEPILEEARQGLGNFNENMQALKRNWFFKGFFKDRGYFDLAELTEHEIPALPSDPFQRIVIASEDLFDEPDTADLKKTKKLKKIGRQVELNPPSLVVISAYTGEKGVAEENLELTRAQAGVVRLFLIRNFRIDEKTVFTKGFGESAVPVAGPPRRLEILFYSDKSAPAPAPSLTQ